MNSIFHWKISCLKKGIGLQVHLRDKEDLLPEEVTMIGLFGLFGSNKVLWFCCGWGCGCGWDLDNWLESCKTSTPGGWELEFGITFIWDVWGVLLPSSESHIDGFLRVLQFSSVLWSVVRLQFTKQHFSYNKIQTLFQKSRKMHFKIIITLPKRNHLQV